MLSRRGLITGLISLAAAPAIVRAASLMPVKVMEPMFSLEDILRSRIDEAYRITREQMNKNLYADLANEARRAFVPSFSVQMYEVSPARFLEHAYGR